jgi:signal transduction histidine kinase
MGLTLIMGTSALLELAAAFLALKLIRITASRIPWVLIAAALCSFALWNCIQIYAVVSKNPLLSWPNLPDELVELLSSVFILAGALYATPLFVTIKQSEEALKESEKKLRYLTTQLLTAQEKERKRISMELHDELGQGLLVLKLQVSAIKDRLRNDQKGLAEEVQNSLNYLDSVIDNVRRLSHNLRPPILTHEGLSSAFRHLIGEFNKHHKFAQCSLDIDDIDGLFSPESQIGIYRVFQECLTNIGKHAQATKVTVAVKRQGGRVSFRVEDNGKGFHVSQILASGASDKGLGLAAMDERVRMLKGSLSISSQIGKGTEITFSIPIEVKGNHSSLSTFPKAEEV